MSDGIETRPAPAVIEPGDFQQILDGLASRGYRILGPTRRGAAIVYDEIHAVRDLPVGWTDDQRPASYRLRPSGDRALFGHHAGPDSWKKTFLPPALKMWEARRENGSFRIAPGDPPPGKVAIIGARPCELAAIKVQDRVLMSGDHPDPWYRTRREGSFILVAQCTSPGATCFCASLATGPGADAGHDLALTEILDFEGAHLLVVEPGSAAGAELLAEVRHRAATEAEMGAVRESLEAAAARMGRSLETRGIRDLLQGNPESPCWDDVAARCLACGNCTLVCPTCFCSQVEDRTDLMTGAAERWRRWDSCFHLQFSYIHGGSVRASTRARYRQWLTHKLSSWIDQFGGSGCVGCGRCITWCPAGIDLTEEVRHLRQHANEAKEVRHGDA